MDWDAPFGAQGPPALASHDGLLHMVHQEHDPNPNRTLIPSASILLQSAFNGDSWTAADAEIVIWDLNFELLPALASYNDMLRMVYVYIAVTTHFGTRTLIRTIPAQHTSCMSQRLLRLRMSMGFRQ